MTRFSRIHNEYLDPDRYSGDDGIDLTDQLTALGKRGHGLCGKDADLDYGGQIRVKQAFWLEDGTCYADLDVFASICEPSPKDGETENEYDARMNEATEIVCTWNDYPGEWTGSDYWQFWLPYRGNNHYHLSINIDWDNDKSDTDNINQAVSALYDAIFADDEIKKFQQSMTSLQKAIEG